jgi:hypothetical protein
MIENKTTENQPSQNTAGKEKPLLIHAGGCFPAGTNVWTEQGKTRIENIKVGDYVLSAPEDGGEQAYKKVVKTFIHEDKTLRDISYVVNDITYVVAATDNHPFWVIEEELGYDEDDEESVSTTVLGWTAAENLRKFDHLVRLKDGSLARVVANVPVYRTNIAGHGWAAEKEDSVIGYVKNYLNREIVANNVPEDQSITWGDSPRLKVRVYNIEVEDFHTYYVAGGGVWVGDESKAADQDATQPARAAD